MIGSPSVSVILPVLQAHPGQLREAVRSVLEQSHADLELIVVEDPSPQTAEALLSEFHDSRVRYFRNSSRTCLVDQLNQALGYATADLVARMDADDVCEPNRLALQVEYLRVHPDISVLGSQLTIIDSAGQRRGWRQYPVDHAAIVESMQRFNPLAHPSVIYRKQAVLGVGGYGYRKHPAVEDYDLWSRLAKAGVRFANHPEPLLRYRIHPGAMKTTRLHGIIRGTLDVKRLYWVDCMGWRARWKMRLERSLLLLPPSLVLKLFVWTQYQTRRPS